MKEMNGQFEGDKTFKKKLDRARSSPFKAYKEMNVGEKGILYFINNELCNTLVYPFPGAAGILLRKFLIPRLLKKSEGGVVIGRSVTIRHPHKIEIGKNVTIDDYVLIDARGHEDIGIKIGDKTSLNRNCVLKAKTGPIEIGSMTNIGGNTSIISNSGVTIGNSVLIAGGCYINAGGYKIDDIDENMASHGVFSKGPIIIGDDVWIGTGAIILDDVKIGSHSIIGAGAVVRQDVPDYSIVAGVPARLVRKRTD